MINSRKILKDTKTKFEKKTLKFKRKEDRDKHHKKTEKKTLYCLYNKI